MLTTAMLIRLLLLRLCLLRLCLLRCIPTAAMPYQVRMPQGGDDKYLAKITERQRAGALTGGENTSIHSAAFW